MIATIDSTAQIIQEPAEAYHARREISRGMLADYFESPRLYEGRHVLKTIPAKEPTPAMEKGSLAHTALLEPGRVQDLYVEYPPELLSGPNQAVSTNNAKQWRDNQKLLGRVPVKSASLEMVRAMAASLARECGAWLKVDGMIERTLTWTHEGTGLPMRCRPDWLRFTKRNTVIGFDLKGTADPTPRSFRNRIEEGLWLQDAHYCEGIEKVLGMKVEAFFFVATEFDAPNRCCVYQLDPQSRIAARETREQLVFDLALALGSGNFADPQEGKVMSVSVRDFAFKRGE